MEFLLRRDCYEDIKYNQKNSPACLCGMQSGFHNSRHSGLVQSVYEFYRTYQRDPGGAVSVGDRAGSDSRRKDIFRKKISQACWRKKVA